MCTFRPTAADYISIMKSSLLRGLSPLITADDIRAMHDERCSMRARVDPVGVRLDAIVATRWPREAPRRGRT
jgi:hypothetical protein